MKNNHALNTQIVEEASSWALKIEDGALSAGDRADLAAWLKASPVHVEELLVASALLAGLAHVDPDKKILIDGILADEGAEVVSFNSTATAPVPTQQPMVSSDPKRVPAWASYLGGLIAASLLLSVVLGPLSPLLYPTTAQEYATMRGEQRTITLADGSLVHINTKTRLRVNYQDDVRAIEVLEGEALFDVEKDPTRPFRVTSGTTVAEALGTKFNVRHFGDDTEVAVIEGRVAVAPIDKVIAPPVSRSPIVLSDGEEVTLSENTVAPQKTKTDIAALTAWRKRQLVFEGDALSDILFEFNRYNKIQLMTSDDALAKEKFSGVFDADDPTSFVAFLKLAQNVHATRIGDDIQLYAE